MALGLLEVIVFTRQKRELFFVVKKQNNEALEFLDVINNQSRIYICENSKFFYTRQSADFHTKLKV